MVGTFIDKRTSKAGKYRPWLLRAGIPLVILAALLFAPLPGVKGSVPFAFIVYFALDLVYSVVNIPYGSLNASLTRNPESVDKLTSTRMMLAKWSKSPSLHPLSNVCSNGSTERKKS